MVLVLVLVPACREKPRPWLSDYQTLKTHMNGVYANLEWSAANGLDLRKLDAETTRALKEAATPVEARVAIEAFLAAFADPHLRLRQPPSSKAPACAPPRRQGMVVWDRVDGFRPLGGGAFLHGVFPSGGDTLGVLRVPSFLARDYPPSCEVPHILDDVAAALADLRGAGATTLVVDLTGNGGGEDWMYVVATQLLGAPPRCPKLAFVRHPHWQKQLQDELADGATPAEQAELEQLMAEVKRPCDLSPLWAGARPSCTQLVMGGEHFPSCPTGTARAPRPAGEKLLVLVDAHTSSAAEALAALLVEQGGARVAGEPTRGAGCGMTNGGAPLELPSLGVTVEMPDCARLFASGENQRAGIQPDVLLAGSDWTPSVAAAIAATR